MWFCLFVLCCAASSCKEKLNQTEEGKLEGRGRKIYIYIHTYIQTWIDRWMDEWGIMGARCYGGMNGG